MGKFESFAQIVLVISVQNQNGGEFNTASFSNLRHIVYANIRK